MAYIKFKPTTPTRRFGNVADFAEITTSKPYKPLTVALRRTGGRNSHGHITSRGISGGHKQRLRLVDFRRPRHGVPAKVLTVEYDPCRTARIALIEYQGGEKSYILCPDSLKVGETVINGYSGIAENAADEKKRFDGELNAALTAAGYPINAADNTSVAKAAHFLDIFTGQKITIILILTYLILLVTMVYGPIAAQLVELYPTRIRYSGLSLPYHIGNGWFGGLLPATAFAISAQSGNIYAGLWYAIVVALMTVVIGTLFVPNGTHKKDIFGDDNR